LLGCLPDRFALTIDTVEEGMFLTDAWGSP
jgi:hypothetical protein